MITHPRYKFIGGLGTIDEYLYRTKFCGVWLFIQISVKPYE